MPRVPRLSTLLRIALVPAVAVVFMGADCGDSGGPSTANVIGVRVQNALGTSIRLEVHVFGGDLGTPTNVAGNGAYVDELDGNAGERVSFSATDNSGVYSSGSTSCTSTPAIVAPSTGTPQQYGQANVLAGSAPGQSLVLECSSGWTENQ